MATSGFQIGFIINEHFDLWHSQHPFFKTDADVIAGTTIREVPATLITRGKQLFHTNVAFSKIYKILRQDCVRDYGTPRFRREDLRKKICPNKLERALDATHTASWIRRKNKDGGYGSIDDTHSVLDAVFWVQTNDFLARHQSACSTRHELCVQFDATFGITRPGFKFCCFVTLDPYGHIIIVAVAALKHLSVRLFTWAFKEFRKSTGLSPCSFITDGCPHIYEALSSVFAPMTAEVTLANGTVLPYVPLANMFRLRQHPGIVSLWLIKCQPHFHIVITIIFLQLLTGEGKGIHPPMPTPGRSKTKRFPRKN
jgi:hypothetical protein